MLVETIRAEWMTARRAKEAVKATLLGTLIGGISNKEKTFNPARSMTEAEIIAEIKKMLDGILETGRILSNVQDRQEQRVKNTLEQTILETFMPRQMSESEIEAFVSARKEEGLNMGAIMAALKAAHPGQYDGKLASGIAKVSASKNEIMKLTNLPYQGHATFLKSQTGNKKVPFAFMGLPYDCSTSFRPGARLAPNAVRQASMMLTDGNHPTLNIDPAPLICDLGDAAIVHVDPVHALLDAEKAVRGLLKENYHPLLSGGDHLMSLSTVRALYHRYKQPIAIIHYDAHNDCWDQAWGETFGHGTWVKNAIDEGIVDATKVFQIGIRSPADAVTKNWLPSRGGQVWSARNSMQETPNHMRQHILATIGRDVPVYVSFDIDALDPAHAPGTGTPEVGGLTTMWAMEMIEELYPFNLVGMDVMEVCPAYDQAGITALAAASLLWTYAALVGLKIK